MIMVMDFRICLGYFILMRLCFQALTKELAVGMVAISDASCCFFCGCPVSESSCHSPNPVIEAISRDCGSHDSCTFHKVCFWWNLSLNRYDTTKSCFICNFVELESRNIYFSRHNMLAAVINCMKLKPESFIHQEMFSLLKPEEITIWEEFKRCKKYWTGKEDFICDDKIIHKITRQLARKQEIEVEEDANLSLLADDMLVEKIQTGNLTSRNIAPVLYRFSRHFYCQLPTEKILQLMIKLVELGTFTSKRFTYCHYQIINSFVYSGFVKFSADEKFALFKHIIRQDAAKVLNAIVEFCKIYRVHISNVLIFDLMEHIFMSSPDSRLEKKMNLLIPLFNLLPEFSSIDEYVQRKMARTDNPRATPMQTIFHAYINSYSKIADELSSENDLSQNGFQHRLERGLVSRLSLQKISLKDTEMHFLLLTKRDLSVSMFKRAIDLVANTSRLMLYCRFVMTHYLQVDWFWNYALGHFRELVLRRSGAEDGYGLMEILLGAERCTVERAIEVLATARKAKNKCLFHHGARLIFYRTDFCKFPPSILCRLYQMVKTRRNCNLVFEFLLNLPDFPANLLLSRTCFTTDQDSQSSASSSEQPEGLFIQSEQPYLTGAIDKRINGHTAASVGCSATGYNASHGVPTDASRHQDASASRELSSRSEGMGVGVARSPVPFDYDEFGEHFDRLVQS